MQSAAIRRFAPSKKGAVVGKSPEEMQDRSDWGVAVVGPDAVVPEGGFVYSINIGNDWPTLYKGDPATYAAQKDEPDYTTQVCTNLGRDVIPTWKVGMKLKIEGLDLTGKTIPTTTPDKKWYDDSSDPYVCTATYTIVN